MKPIEHISIPEFSEFVVPPRNPTCNIIESSRLMVEILWWLHHAGYEFGESTFSNKLILDGDFALVVRYKREKDNTYRPTCTLSFSWDEYGVHIRQIQWSNDKNVAFRFHSSFDAPNFLLRTIEESFIKKWIPVTMERFPKWLEDAAYGSKSSERYEAFRAGIEWLQEKHKRLSPPERKAA